MKIRIDFENKNIQLTEETSMEELLILLDKLPELKEFTIQPLLQEVKIIEKTIPTFPQTQPYVQPNIQPNPWVKRPWGDIIFNELNLIPRYTDPYTTISFNRTFLDNPQTFSIDISELHPDIGG